MMQNPGADWSKLKAIALDLDGVVYQGNEALPGASNAVKSFRDRGVKVYFVTNNSGKSRADIAKKLCAMGIGAGVGDVLNAAFAAGILISGLTSGRSAVVKSIGGVGLEAELVLAGHRLAPNNMAEFLVVGLDTKFAY